MKTRHEKAQAYLNSLASYAPDLPFEPSLLPELFASTASSTMSSTAHVASLVERSQGLAVRVLRLANSAYYGMHTEVSSLAHAIRLLGLNEVRIIVLQLGVASAIRKLNLPKYYPFEELWEHQILTANLAKAMAQTLPTKAFAAEEISPDDLYAAGLLHDVGKTLIAANCPEDWQAIQDLAACENLPFYRAEEDYWGIDHSVTGARLFTFWGLPPKLTEVVGWHHAPRHAEPEYRTATFILAAANTLAHYPLSSLAAGEGGEGAVASPARISLPEDVKALLPQGIDSEKLQEKIMACYDTSRVRGMASATMEA